MVPGVDSVLVLEWNGAWARRALNGDAIRPRETGAATAILLPNSFSARFLTRAGVADIWGCIRCGTRLLCAVPGRDPLHQGDYPAPYAGLRIERDRWNPSCRSSGPVIEAQALLADRGGTPSAH
jgi:hypothetical protein